MLSYPRSRSGWTTYCVDTMVDVLPLIRSAHRTRKEAGLAGEDKVSKLLNQLLTLAEALTVSGRMQHPPKRVDWAIPILCALVVVAFFAGGLAGWLRRDNALLQDCISQIQIVQGQQACWVYTRSLY